MPEALTRTEGPRVQFTVRGRTFAYWMDYGREDTPLSICCKAPPSENTRLIAHDPERFFMPKYLGPKGWLAFRLDLRQVDWSEAERLLADSYALVAPSRLAALLA